MVVLPLERPWSFKEMGYQNFGSSENNFIRRIEYENY
jgi:hypothetical protein